MNMKIGHLLFNTLTLQEYIFYIDNHKKYSDFNVLGLYRSIPENSQLDMAQKIEVREYAHLTFRKAFDFLQLKDPDTYMKVSTLGQDLTKADKAQLWEEVRLNQEKILKDKKIKHRNFGTYSKHKCGYEHCPYNGLMIRQGTYLAYGEMHFKGDKNKNFLRVKSDMGKQERKKARQLINKILRNEPDEEG